MSPRKNEILSTIAEAYSKIVNSKLKFVIVEEESLKVYVTSKKQKADNMEFTLMKNDICYIEDIIPKKNSDDNKKTDTPGKDDEIQKLHDSENEGDNLGKNMSEIGEKDNFDFNLDRDKNPFTGVLIGGSIATRAGVGAAVGSIAALTSAGFAFLGGLAATGIGLVVAVPSLIGFGAYKIYKTVKDKDKKKFFDSFNLEKMKIEKEFQQYVICKMDDYFNKRIIIENNDEIEKYINNIIDIYISIDNQIIESKIDLDHNKLLDKIKKEGKIVVINISKIRQELMKTILGYADRKVINILEQGIPIFKEFIKNFGPLKIDENDEKEIDKNISKIIDIMKEILEKKMKVAFNKFDAKVFINSFELKLEELYDEKKNLDDISKKDFISKCKDYIVEPIANNSQNYGVLSLLFKFTIITQKICAKKKADNYNLMKEKIIKKNQNVNQNNIKNNTFFYSKTFNPNFNPTFNPNFNPAFNPNFNPTFNPTFNPNFNPNMNPNIFYQQNPMFNHQMAMFSQMQLMQGMVGQNMPLNQNPAPLQQNIVDTPKPLNKDIKNNNNKNLDQNQYINIEFIFDKRKIFVQGDLNLTEEELIQKFKAKLCDDNIIINKYLIEDKKTEINPNSKKKLKELGINSDIKIIVTSD